MILALDLGTQTGYAVGDANCPPVSGVLNLSDMKGDHPGARFLRFMHHLDRLSKLHTITKIVYEQVAHVKFVKAAHTYGGFQAYLMGWCMIHNVPLEGIGVKTIKKFATGNGNANKEMMVAAAIGEGWLPKDDNEADALWILKYAITPAVAPIFEQLRNG